MKASDVWLQVGERIGFYTHASSRDIPEAPGVYGWFLPLHLYSDEAAELIDQVQAFLRFETSTEDGQRNTDAAAELNWERFDLNIHTSPKVSLSDGFRAQFGNMCADERQREPFSFALMAASILMPPLYVGKADSLRQRYLQHVGGGSPYQNNFHNRFSRFVSNRGMSLRVKDLLFVAIPLPDEVQAALKGLKLNELLERIVLSIANPPFSIR